MDRRSFRVVFILLLVFIVGQRGRISRRVEKSTDRFGRLVRYIYDLYIYIYILYMYVIYVYYIYKLKRSGDGSNELPKKAGSTYGSISDGRELGRIRRGIRNRFGYQPALFRSIATFGRCDGRRVPS